MPEDLNNPQNPLEEDYVEQIKKLKETTVSKEVFEKLKGENKKLLEALVDGKEIEVERTEEALTKADYVKVLNNPDVSNLEYCKAALGVRNLVLAEKGVDIFMPNASASAEDKEKAQAVADVIQECIDYADGDSALFTQELIQRRTVDYKTGK